MKRLLRTINASTEVQNRNYTINPSETFTRITFSPIEVVELLKIIEELKGLVIDIEETPEGNVEFIVGDGIYTVTMNN